MSREIDERVVAMQFNNRDFEKKAKQSIDTLKELNEELQFDGAADSFKQLSKATSKSFGLKKTNKVVDTFSKSLRSMGNTAKNFAMAPLKSLGNVLSSLGKYSRTMLGIDIGAKLASTGENLVKSFTVDPLKTGWDEYELKMDSIKTIMTGTEEEFRKQMGKNYTEQAHLEKVKQALEELNKYADDTIYSFKDMTSSIGKFTNNGVKLNDAVAAMKGISNAAALAGQGTQQASMAMYNLSQAISVGKLTTMDWKSIENANMATVDFKNTFIQVAAAMGKLEKIGNKYYVKEEKNAKSASKTKKKLTKEEQEAALKAREVTAENFRNTLNKGWADSSVITSALKVFSGDMDEIDLNAMGISVNSKLAKSFKKLGDKAKKSATEVRTFSKMMDALKESAQSGWAMSFEYIFGDVGEATSLWSKWNDKLSGILSKQAETRNKLLLGWRGLYKDDKGNVRKIKGAIDGRKILIEAVDRLFAVVRRISGGVSQAFEKVFGKLTSKKLVGMTKNFNKFTKDISTWFGTLKNKNSNISKISKGLQGILTIIRSVWKTIKTLWGYLSKPIDTVVTGLIDAFAGFGKVASDLFSGDLFTFFSKLVSSFSDLENSGIGKWLSGIKDSFEDTLTSIGDAIAKFLKDHGLGGLVDYFTPKWQNFEKKGKKRILTNGPSQFEEDFKPLFDVFESIKTKLSEAFNGIFDYFTSKKTTVKTKGKDGKVKETVKKEKSQFEKDFEPLFSAVGNIETNLAAAFSSLKNYFSPKEELEGKSQFDKDLNEVVTWIMSAWDTAWGFISPLVDTVGHFLTDALGYIKSLFTEKRDWRSGQLIAKAPIEQAFDDVVEWVQSAWNTTLGFITPLADTAGHFLTDAWGFIKSLFTEKRDWRSGQLIAKAPIAQAFDDVVEWVQSAWKTAEGFISPLADTAGHFLTDAWGFIKGLFTAKRDWRSGQLIAKAPIEQAFDDIVEWVTGAWETAWGFISPLADTAGHFLADAWGFIKGLFTAEHDERGVLVAEAPIVTFLTDIAETVSKAWDSVYNNIIQPLIEPVGRFLSNVWDFIINAFKQENGETSSDSSSIEETSIETEQSISFIDSIVKSLTDLVNAVKGWTGWSSISGFFTTVFGGISDIIKQVSKNTVIGKSLDLIERAAKVVLDIVDRIIGFAERLLAGDTGATIELVAGVIAGIVIKWVKMRTVVGKAKIAKNSGDSIGNTLLKIAISVGIIAVAVASLGALPDDVLKKGGAAIAQIALVVAGIGALFKVLFATGQEMQSAPETATERVATKAIENVGMWLIIGEVMKALPEIIKALSGSDLKPGLLIEAATSMVLIIGAAVTILSVIGKFNAGTGIVTGALYTILGLEVFLAGLIGVITSIGLLIGADDKGDTIKVNLERVKTFMTGLGEILGSFVGGYTGSKDGQYISTMTDAIGEASQSALNIDQTGLDKLKTAMEALKTIGDNLPKDTTAFEKFFTGKLQFKDVGDMLWSLVDGLARATNVSMSITDDKLKRFNSVFGVLEHLLSASEFFVKYDNFSGKGAQGLMEFMTNLMKYPIPKKGESNRLTDNLNAFSKTITEMVELFNGAIETAAPDISIQPLIDAMINDLNATDDKTKQKIQQAFKNLLGSYTNTDFNFNPPTGTNGFNIGQWMNVDLSSDDPAGVNSMLSGISSKIDLTGFQEKGDAALAAFKNGISESLDETGSIPMAVTPIFTEENMPDWLTGEDLTVTGTVALDEMSISSLQRTITYETDRTVTAIRTMSSDLYYRIGTLDSAIRSLQIVLDTGVIAGEVDRRLGSDYVLSGRR